MSEKRRDNKGRILRTGESQRKDLIYQYRYTDIRGKRRTIYSSNLSELRKKEAEILKQLSEGIDYAAGQITVIALVERYIRLKQGTRYNTKVGYKFVLNIIKKEDFGYRQIRDIKVSDAQAWMIKLHDDGRGYSTLTSVTLNVYTHANYDLAAEQMLEIIDFPSAYVHQEQRKSG